MELMTVNFKTNVYIQSEAEFNRAKLNGFWEMVGSVLTSRQKYLQPFNLKADPFRIGRMTSLGVQDISINEIVGSVGRSQDFTRRFLPRLNSESGKERWRAIYILAVTGKGFPPIEVYKIDQTYFVKDGHHRVSVAKHLGWDTIQAQVTALSPSVTENFEEQPQLSLSQGGCLC